MSITVVCPSCSSSYEVAAESAGRKGRCKRCGNILRIPAAAPPRQADDAPDPDGYALAGDDARRAAPLGSSTFVPARARSEPERAPTRVEFTQPLDRAVQTDSETRSLDLAILLGIGGVSVACAAGLICLVVFVPGGAYPAGIILWMIGTCFMIYAYWSGSHQAFEESFTRGLLFRVFPPYTLSYLFSRGSETRRELCYMLIGFALWFTGSVAMQSVFVKSLKEVGIQAEEARPGP